MSTMLLTDEFFEALFRSSCEFRLKHINHFTCYHPSFNVEAFEYLIPALRKANEHVWNKAYPNNVYNSTEPMNLTRQGGYQSNERAFYKSLQCLKYQLSESSIKDDTINFNAFNTLKSFIDIVGNLIITKHDDYESAPWGEVETLTQAKGA